MKYVIWVTCVHACMCTLLHDKVLNLRATQHKLYLKVGGYDFALNIFERGVLS